MIDLIAKAEALEAMAKEFRAEAERDTATASLFDRVPEFVKGLGQERVDAYALLLKDGFKPWRVLIVGRGDPFHAWTEPADNGPLTTEQIKAVAELQTVGFGGVVRPA